MASSPAPSALSMPPQLPFPPKQPPNPKPIYKDLHFNHDLSATKKLQVGVDLVARLLGVTLGPRGRNVVLQNPYGPPKIVKDGETVLREIELDDPMENLGVKLVRQAGAKTNAIAGDGCTTSIILAQGLIAEGIKVLAAGMNPVQIARGMEKTAQALVSELRFMSREILDNEIESVATVSAGNDQEIGRMIAEAFNRVGRNGFIRIENGRLTENNLEIVEGMQFDRGYLSPYFVTDRTNMQVEFTDCKILLVDKKISDVKEMFKINKILDAAVKEKFPLLIIAEDVESDALGLLIKNKLKGTIKIAVIKAPAFGARKSDYLDDLAIVTGGRVVRDEIGLTLERARKEQLGSAAKIVITKESTLIVTDGSTQNAAKDRIATLRRLVENSKEKFQKKILNERIARLTNGIAIIQVGAQTVVELKDKKLRIEDALNATKAAIEEGVVVGGGCSLLRLSLKVDEIKARLDNEEQKIGADIFKRALRYPSKLIAENSGKNGNFVVDKILANSNLTYGYNAANNCYEDLIAAGILDPTKVVRCCILHASSVAKTFLISDLAVVEKKTEPIQLPRLLPTPNMMMPKMMMPPRSGLAL
ncbi:chaperonin 60 beta [Rhynchospora pubera]|uniref:Chaperonin 60 beta n=1 Tax=Rhynchospora pubera TaxID=906938 RepID=A0AAV8H2X8_9POAL|nr:chaperonin 60 beta [Rhynchospora pubera]